MKGFSPIRRLRVSWMRKRDLHILTSNIYTYTGDQRFSVIHPPDSDDWDLKIEYAQQKDSGIYECQVNTEPKINLAVYLDVTELAEHFEYSSPIICSIYLGVGRLSNYLHLQMTVL
uniref:Ig-like domain-containing protein n=1 Tax=Anopheles stephensi TaxID=30069 RepID=A0A182YHV2_ANOST